MNTFDSLKIDPSGCNLIEASAGTGKTFAIASLYVRLVIENDECSPENILVVTFTEAATKELRDRIRKRLREARDAVTAGASKDPFLAELISDSHPAWPGGKEARIRLERALQTFDCAAISTIHGFCSRALQENAFESGALFDTELVKEQKSLIQQIADDFWRSRFFAADSLLLPLALKNGWSPEFFAGFLSGKLTNPLLKIVPSFTPEDVAEVETKCLKIYDELCILWKKKRSEIEKILLEHKGLSISADNYRPDKIPELIAGMDTYSKNNNPFDLFAGCQKLSLSYMQNNRLKKEEPVTHPFFSLWDDMILILKQKELTTEWELLEFARKRLPERKAALNVRFFDDLLSDLYRALAEPGGEALAVRMRSKYRAALIDEFQDTDQIQYRIFRTVFREGSIPLFLIGDPKQAIYSFRGADIYAYLEAKADVPEEHHHTMLLNWRSSGKLVQAVNRLFTINSDINNRPLVIDKLAYPEVNVPHANLKQQEILTVGNRDESPLQVWFFKPGPEDTKGVIAIERAIPRIVRAVTFEISGLLKDAADGKAAIGNKPLSAGDIAVIVRDHRQAQKVYDSLLSCGIPAVVRSNLSIFQTKEALELCIILNALSEPGHEARVRAALATGILGRSADEIARTFDADGEADWERCLNSFREHHELWKKQGFISMFRTFLEAEEIRKRLLSRQGGERSITNLLHCAELLHAEAIESKSGADALCTWFSEQVASPPEGDEHQIRLESDENAVKILTIHVSKGLEFPVVFCPFLWRGVIEPKGTVTAHENFELVADYGSPDYAMHKKTAMYEGLAENVRLLYVALTRAKFRCYMVYGTFSQVESSAIAYLLHAPSVDDSSSAYDDLVLNKKNINEAAMLDSLNKLESPGIITLVEAPEEQIASPLLRLNENSGGLNCRSMTNSIRSDWRVASFSSLIDGHGALPELPDHDSSEDQQHEALDTDSGVSNIFSFPKGALPGTILHSIFENIDFAADDSSQIKTVVSKTLEASTIKDGPKYTDAVCKMVESVLKAELSDGLRLSSLQPGNWIQEMEFYFPLRSIDPKLLTDFFRKQGISSPVNLEQVASRLDFQSVRGMLLGFIDLVFCHDGRYYILDWKSNHLGSQPDNYHPDNLAREMERKLYPLQYLLYTVAVNRYLQRRIPQYSYEKHFGGVFYLFLRGIDAVCPGNGIYYDKPDAAVVKGLTQCLIAIEEA